MEEVFKVFLSHGSFSLKSLGNFQIFKDIKTYVKILFIYLFISYQTNNVLTMHRYPKLKIKYLE